MGRSAIYEGWVMHRRLRPKAHRFKYRVFAMLLDLDELPALDRKLSLFAHNRRGLFSFQDRDHGDGRDLNTWLNDLLAQAGISANGRRRVVENFTWDHFRQRLLRAYDMALRATT